MWSARVRSIPVAAVLDAAPEVAAAHHDADLHATGYALLDYVAHTTDHVEVQATAGLSGQRLAAQFQKDPLILRFTHTFNPFIRYSVPFILI